MSGQRVMAVGIGYNWADATLDEGAFSKASTLLARLQVIGEAASTEQAAIIPFRVGDAYVLAPETREDVDARSNATAMDLMGEGVQIDCALTSLTPEQIRALGSDEGLAVRDLPEASRALLAHALHPPLKMPDGSVTDKPLDWKNVRIRARLELNGAAIPNESGASFLSGEERYGKRLRPARTSPQLRAVSPAAMQTVPNVFRPSDLEGKAYTRPLGVHGRFTIREVLQRLEKLTGLTLRAASYLQDVPVFLGSDGLTAGEVIDGLRLGVTGAFRRLGNVYILAWEKRGLGALQQLASESTGATEEAEKRSGEASSSPNWLVYARDLPFDVDDPLALTPEQQSRFFDSGGWPVGDGPWPDREQIEFRIPFAEMTPGQQEFLRRIAKTDTIWSPGGGRRAVTEEDLQNATLENEARVTLSLSAPGRGWMRVHAIGFGEIRPDRLAMIQWTQRQEEKRREAARAGETPPAWQPKPREVPAPERGLVVPALGPGRLSTLAGEMRRHGLNVLFYPALDGGYATFPSKAFPLDPALREKDGLAAAVAAMKAEGIRVVPYVSVLAWQRPEDTVHWLNRHPDWVDRDLLGRTRLEWAAQHPYWTRSLSLLVLETTNFVSPTAPQVRAKLEALLSDLTAKDGFSGVALLDWQPGGERGNPHPDLPAALGFSFSDRLAAFRATGEDPVDAPLDPTTPWKPFWPRAFEALGISPTPRNPDGATRTAINPHTVLVERLIQSIKGRQPGWTVHLLDDPVRRQMTSRTREGGAEIPKDAEVLTVSRYLNPEVASAQILPVWPQSLYPSDVPEAFRSHPAIAQMNVVIRPTGSEVTFRSPLVLFDFRAAPGEITESLSWIVPPGRSL